MKGFIAASVLGLSAGIGIAACVGVPSQVAISQETLPDAPAYMIVLGEVFGRPACMQGYASKLALIHTENLLIPFCDAVSITNEKGGAFNIIHQLVYRFPQARF